VVGDAVDLVLDIRHVEQVLWLSGEVQRLNSE
jgi:hypothetical protein